MNSPTSSDPPGADPSAPGPPVTGRGGSQPARAASLGFGGAAAALRVKDFRTYIITNCISLIGLWIQRIAVQALAWELTQSALWLGLMALVDLAPALLFGPFAGAMADRFDRKRLAYSTQVISMIQAVALAGFTLAGRIDIWLLLALTALGGINTAFWGPVRQSIVPNLVPREHLATAVALGSLNFNLARFIGPAIAGPIIVLANSGAAFAINAATYLAFLVALHFITVPPVKRAPHAPGRRDSLLGDTIDGLVYALKHPGLGPLLVVLFIGGTALRPLVELLAGYADMVHGRGTGGFAILTAAMGAGSILAAGWLAVMGTRVDHFATVVWSGIGGGVCLIALAVMPNFELAVAAVVLAAIALALNGISGQIMMQLTVPDAMRGRVLSLYTGIFRGTPALGALVIGALADLAGFEIPLAAAGLVGILVFGWTQFNRRLGEHLRPNDDA